MELTVLGSSSTGNCYLLETEKEILIIEAGVNLREIKKAVNWSKIVGAIVTHEHGDHSKSVMGLMRLGINVYSGPGTFKALKITKNVHRAKKMQAQIAYKIGEFNVFPFDVEHDAAQPFGFLIRHQECGTIVFITDTHYVKYKFPIINHLLIECNYSHEILDRNIEKGKVQILVRNRLLKNHLSLSTLKKFLKVNNIKKVQNIVLLHLSEGNSNAMQFKKEIKNLTGKKVYIADKNLTLNINKTPF